MTSCSSFPLLHVALDQRPRVIDLRRRCLGCVNQELSSFSLNEGSAGYSSGCCIHQARQHMVACRLQLPLPPKQALCPSKRTAPVLLLGRGARCMRFISIFDLLQVLQASGLGDLFQARRAPPLARSRLTCSNKQYDGAAFPQRPRCSLAPRG